MTVPGTQDYSTAGPATARQGPVLLVAFAMGTALSLILFSMMLDHERALARMNFDRWAHNHTTILQSRIEHDLQVVESIAGLFTASGSVERDGFRQFVQIPLSAHMAVQWLGWVPRIPEAGRSVYEEQARREGFAGFQFTERREGRLVRAAQRAEYFPAYFVEPLAGNESAAGFDIASDPLVLPALEEARDTGQTVLTTPHTLLQEPGEKLGFLVLRAVYRKGASHQTVAERRANLLGYVTGAFNAVSVVEAAWNDISPAGLDIALYDDAVPGGKLLDFHPSRPYKEAAPKEPGPSQLTSRTTIRVPGRQWSLVFSPAPSFWAAYPTERAYVVLLCGLLVTGLFTTYLYKRTRSAARVAQLAVEVAQANRGLEESYERVARAHQEWVDAFDSIRDPIFLHDQEGRILRANRTYARLAGKVIHEVLGKPYWEVFPKADGPLQSCLEARQEHVPVSHNEEISGEDGRVFHSRAFAARDENGHYRYSVHILEDITERKHAEQELHHRLGLERLVSTISANFVNLLPSEIDPAINSALEAVGSFAGVDRSYVFRLSPDVNTMDNTHEWCAAGIEPQKHVLQGLAVEQFPWSLGMLKQGQVVHVPRIADLPPEAGAEKAIFQAQDIQSLVLVPLIQGRQLVGFLGFDSVRTEQAWPEEDVRLLKLIGEVFVNAWMRMRVEEALRESEARFHQLANATPQFVWTADAAGRVNYYSRQWYAFTGFPEGRVSDDADALSLMHPNDVQRSAERWRQSIRTGQPYENQLRLREGRTGEYRWHLSRAVPMRDGNGHIIEWFGITIDIHAQKQAEEALKDADQRKDEFLAMLAHELRNPLAPIRNAVHVLKLRGRPSGNTVHWAADLIDRQISHLARLVDDLLDVARITMGKIQLHREPVDLNAVLRRAAEVMDSSVKAHHHELTVLLPETPTWMEGDPARLIQVVDNLLNNAVKYTEDGGRIQLALECAGGDEAVIRIRDSGVGIAPELLARIFEPFRQADHSLARAQGGLGLGLTLVHRLVEMHGGRVEAFSEGPGKGSEFRVYLPLADAGKQAAQDSTAAMHATMRAVSQRVLVVDDNQDVANSFAMLLNAMGHEVRVVYDGAAALEAVPDFQPDVILLDIGLPRMDGYEVARRLRAQYPTERLRLAAVTGYGQAADRERGREAGFDYHLVKPVTPEALEKVLELG